MLQPYQQCMSFFVAPHPCQQLLWSVFFHFSLSVGCVVVSLCNFNLHLQMINDNKVFLMHLLAICLSSFVKWLFSICSVFIGLLVTLLLTILYTFFLNIFYWLCYYSCPSFPPLPTLYPVLPFPPAIPPLSSCPWVTHISSLALSFPILFLISPCLFCICRLMLLNPCTFSPILPHPVPNW